MELVITKQVSISIFIKDPKYDESLVHSLDLMYDKQLNDLGFSVDNTEIIDPEDE